VRHVGYADPGLRGRKLGRDLRLLELEDAERPDDPFTLFNLGRSGWNSRRTPAALACCGGAWRGRGRATRSSASSTP